MNPGVKVVYMNRIGTIVECWSIPEVEEARYCIDFEDGTHDILKESEVKPYKQENPWLHDVEIPVIKFDINKNMTFVSANAFINIGTLDTRCIMWGD